MINANFVINSKSMKLPCSFSSRTNLLVCVSVCVCKRYIILYGWAREYSPNSPNKMTAIPQRMDSSVTYLWKWT